MPQVSIFKNVTEIENPEDIELITYLEQTRDGRWEDIVTKCRSLSKEEQKEFKKTMPTTTLSGTFTVRRDNGSKTHSEFIAMDIDDVPNINSVRATLAKDKYVYSVFMSTSGYGLRALFKIESSKHREAFAGIMNYLYETYGIVCDPNGVNISKPYIVSYDPYLYINPDEVPVIRKYVKEKPIKKMPDFVHTTGDFDMILKQIVGRGVNICESYNDWLKLGFAISEQFGENGRSAFHEISRMSQKYEYGKCDRQYTYCLRARGTTKANISTFYYLAKTAGINIVSEQTKTIVKTTRSGKKTGLSKEQIIENLKKFSGIEGADEIVEKVFDQDRGSDEEEEESILHLLEIFVYNNYSLQMNEVTGYLEQNGVQLSPGDLNTIFVAAKKIVHKLDYQLMMRLLKSDFTPTYNPFFKFLDSDGIPVELPAIPEKEQNSRFSSPLIDKLASTIVNDNPHYTTYFLRKWMVGIISAMHKVHSPLLFCLLGGQNTGKTEWFRRLLPKELQLYYAESKLDKEKDDELVMTENILVMDDELGGKSKQDNLKLNNITSKQWFSLRRPYGDHNEKILRLAVLCGTSNYYTVFNDPTGNRRIIPIEVIDINKELYNSIDKSELFKEAFRLYKEGFDWRVTMHDILYLNTDKDRYESVVKEKELLSKYYEPGEEFKMSTTEIIVEIEHLTKQKLNVTIVGRELDAIGFVRKTTRVGTSTIKKWFVNKIGRVQPLDPYKTNGNAEDSVPF